MYLIIVLYSLSVLFYFLEGLSKEIVAILCKALIVLAIIRLLLYVADVACLPLGKLTFYIVIYTLCLIPAISLEGSYGKKS